MAKRKNSGEIEPLLGEMLSAAEGSQKSGYRLFSIRKSKKAARHKAVEVRLAKTLDADDPRLTMAKIKAAKAGETAAAFNQRATRLRKKPKLGDNEWMVSGNVRYANRRSASGLIVQVYDKDLKYDDVLGKTTTNDFGDFHIVYDTCRFDDEWGNNRPDLFLRIWDKNGKLLSDHTEPLRVDSGHVEYFEVVVDASSRLGRRGNHG